jgi:diguanylate cyclase (GGDEF)-like protein
MKISTKSNDDLHQSGVKKTAFDLMREHEQISLPVTECTDKRPVSIIVLCDDSTPFDTQILGATPHVAIDIKDDLLEKIRELQEENIKLRSLSLIDNLTGLFNNRFFWSQMEIEMARTKRTGHLCSLMMIDVDNFKLLNDTFGHLEGDKFLVEFGRIMHDNARSTDLIYRYGGDEFAVIMPATSVADAIKTGERFRDILAKMPQKITPAISLSIGISAYSSYSSYSINEFVHAADLAMYEAKKSGKNRICIDANYEKTVLQSGEVNPDEKEFLLMEY